MEEKICGVQAAAESCLMELLLTSVSHVFLLTTLRKISVKVHKTILILHYIKFLGIIFFSFLSFVAFSV